MKTIIKSVYILELNLVAHLLDDGEVLLPCILPDGRQVYYTRLMWHDFIDKTHYTGKKYMDHVNSYFDQAEAFFKNVKN